MSAADRLDFFEYLTNEIKTLKEHEKKEKRNLEIITLTFPFHADSHVGDDLRRIKEMGVDHAILQLTEPDMNRVIDIAKQVSKFAK